MKTHLCGILVHDEDLYLDVWIDSHHKHDSNQVITSIMNVINDVRDRRGGLLPLVLCIQADNCGRENKNQYMFAFCASLVGLGYFAEVYLSFLLVGHTHKDIDQRFSVISSTLKRLDIDLMQELSVSTLRLINFGKTVLYFCVLQLQNCTFCTWI